MTAVATPSQEAPRPAAPDATSSPKLDSGRRAAAPSLALSAEVALAVVTLVTVAGLWRLFVDRSYLAPLAAHAVAAHLVAATLRRRGMSLATSGLVISGVALAALCWSHLWDTTTLGVPSLATWHEAADRLRVAWHSFSEVSAPAPVLPGFALAMAAVLWAVAWSADTAAFRLWAPFEALLPSGTVFLFASLLAADEARLLAAALWLAAALGFVLVHRVSRQQASPSWLGSDPQRGSRALLGAGTLLGLGAVTFALLAGPHLPGSGDAALIELDPDEGSSRQTVSPLVEIQGRLLEQSNTALFSVVTNRRAYWRLTSLDIFDGEVWSSRGSFGRAEGALEGVPGETEGAMAVTQSIQITGLSAIWVPAAFEPRTIDASDADIRWEPESSTLIVSTDHPTSDGLVYQVTSAVPTFEPAELQRADGHIPRGVGSRALDLPVTFPRRVIDEARRVVVGAATPYDQARALQDYFRSGAFEYSLNAPSGQSATAIESFLFDTRTGFCEQFAGTYAAMSRAVGLPSRVAVGFTPGEQDPLAPERYVVRGEHAHAWPEVYLAGVGWVAFEPTPGRGAPGAQGYTGVAESQDTAGPSTEPSAETGTGPQFPTELGTGEGTETGSSTTLPDIGDLDAGADDRTDGAAADEGIDGRDLLRFIRWSLIGVLGAAMVVVLAAVSVGTWRLLRRARRRARADTPEDRVRVAWAEAVESVEVLGVTRRRDETPLEFARRLGAAIDGDRRPGPLARAVEQADFAPTGVSEDEAAEAADLARGIRSAVRRRTTARQRLLAAVDPRPPERRGRTRGPRPTGPRIQIRGNR